MNRYTLNKPLPISTVFFPDCLPVIGPSAVMQLSVQKLTNKITGNHNSEKKLSSFVAIQKDCAVCQGYFILEFEGNYCG
jgi:hypothetical protein